MIIRTASWALRVATAGALAIDAYLHADLAQEYDLNRNATISQGDLFRVEAGVASLAALLILVLATRVTWALAFVVAASALGAVQIYAHYDIGRLGPLPNMYEPLWFSEKTRAAIAETVATGTAALGFVVAWLSAVRAGPNEQMRPTNQSSKRSPVGYAGGRCCRRASATPTDSSYAGSVPG